MLTGGDLLGSGAYGCVWIPPLTCKPGTTVSIPKNRLGSRVKKVDKLLSIKDATTEFKIAKRIHEIPEWQKHFVVADELCTPAPVSQQKEKEMGACDIVTGEDLSHLRLLRMNFAGDPLDTYEINVKSFNFRNFVTSALEGVALLILNSIVHMDLHSGNARLDNEQHVRIIDWNLAIDVLNEPNLEGRLYHSYTLRLTQESPDFLLMNARFKKLTHQDEGVPPEQKLVRDMVEQKPVMKRQRAVLGMTKAEQLKGVRAFVNSESGSAAYQHGDFEGWFKTHWQMNDSWAIGSMIVGVIAKLSLFPQYQFPPEFNGPKSPGYRVLRKLCHPNPFERYDAVEALAELYPDNHIIKTYAPTWLQPSKPQAPIRGPMHPVPAYVSAAALRA
jgi:serine/threonine protein kinase